MDRYILNLVLPIKHFSSAIKHFLCVASCNKDKNISQSTNLTYNIDAIFEFSLISLIPFNKKFQKYLIRWASPLLDDV